ncbi:MAG TPA: alpha/beta fold hydrolase [Ilumatobacteraceae bacterium]|nr:alpha/beta fold hydrolase [Ilumatobacteraceae bacterium]
MASHAGQLEATGSAPAPRTGAPTRTRRDELLTDRVSVDGRTVSYARGGHGLPVLFLHGWGLDHESDRRALRRLTARGCNVIAPSLPGFGRSDELPVLERTLVGYARWVDRFLEAIGADEPVVVLGHSFGGGIATRFAHDRPERVRYLVMLNAVGDAQSFAAGGLAGRPERIGLDAVRSLFDALRPSDDLATIGQMQRTLLANLRRHPFSVLQAAQAALTADLRAEMAVLAARALPVLVLWSDGDRLIPIAAFDTFCSAFGTDGHVVRGGHSWLLANPDVFGEVLDNVIHVEGQQHGARAATTSVDEVRRLLATTSLPPTTARRLLDGVSPMWALSESPEVLAADLALCHPRVRPGEVRAVARQLPDGDRFRLTVVAQDRRGLLADTTAVLATAGVSVDGASVMTWPEHRLAVHALTVRSDGGIDDGLWEQVGARLQASAETPVRMLFRPTGRARVTTTGAGTSSSIVRVTAPDDIGLLSATCRWFADHGISIEAAGIDTTNGVANDVFLIDGDCDTSQLAAHLSRAPRRSSQCVRLLRLVLDPR